VIEAGNAIGMRFRREHDDRHVALGANTRAHFHAVEFGQHQVEHDEIRLLEGAFEAGESVASGLDFVAFMLELELEHAPRSARRLPR